MKKHTRAPQDHNRVLRKRNKQEEILFEKPKNILLNTKVYNVFDEHNYFHSFEKKCCRWPKEIVSSVEELLTDDKYNSLPDWLTKGWHCSDEEDDNNEVKSLSYILKIEFKKDLEYENQKNKNKCTIY